MPDADLLTAEAELPDLLLELDTLRAQWPRKRRNQ